MNKINGKILTCCLFLLFSPFLYAQPSKIWTFPPKFNYYFILEHSVNIYSHPSLNSRITEQLKLNDEIYITERTDVVQEIDHVWGYWYKIKKDKMEGYIFGGYIAVSFFRDSIDIDGNGIYDYVYSRISNFDGDYWELDGINDIFIYINGKRIATDILITGLSGKWNGCSFALSKTDGTVLIILRSRVPAGTFYSYFRINKDCTIQFEEAVWIDFTGLEDLEKIYHFYFE